MRLDSLILSDRAKVLTAMAIDCMAGVHSRNDRPDVNAACAALRAAIAKLEAIDGVLEG